MILKGNTQVKVYLTETTVKYGEWEEISFETLFRDYEYTQDRYKYSIEFTDFSKWALGKPRIPEKVFRQRIFYTGEERRSEILTVDVEFDRVSTFLGVLYFKYSAVFKEVAGTIDGVCVTDMDDNVLIRSPLTPITLSENSEYVINGTLELRTG